MACFHFSLTVPTHVSFCIWASKEAWLGAHHCLPWFIAGLGLRCRTITQIQNSNITLFNQCCWCEIRTTRNSTSYARLLGMKNYRKAFSGPNRFIQSYTHHRDSQLNHRTARLFCLPKCDLQGLSVRLIRKVVYSNCNFNSISVQVWIELTYVPTKSFGQPLKPPAMWTNPTRLLQVQKLFRSLAVSHRPYTFHPVFFRQPNETPLRNETH